MRPSSRNAEPRPVPSVIPTARAWPRAAPAQDSPSRNASASLRKTIGEAAQAEARRRARGEGRRRRGRQLVARPGRRRARSRTAPAPRRRTRLDLGGRRGRAAVSTRRSSSSSRAASAGSEVGVACSATTDAVSRSTRAAATCVPPMSSAPTIVIGTNAFTTLRPAREPADAVGARRRRDDDRLGVREAVRRAGGGLDVDSLALDEVERRGSGPRVSSAISSSKSSRCTAKKSSGSAAERELRPAVAARGRRAAPGSARANRRLRAGRGSRFANACSQVDRPRGCRRGRARSQS